MTKKKRKKRQTKIRNKKGMARIPSPASPVSPVLSQVPTPGEIEALNFGSQSGTSQLREKEVNGAVGLTNMSGALPTTALATPPSVIIPPLGPQDTREITSAKSEPIIERGRSAGGAGPFFPMRGRSHSMGGRASTLLRSPLLPT